MDWNVFYSLLCFLSCWENLNDLKWSFKSVFRIDILLYYCIYSTYSGGSFYLTESKKTLENIKELQLFFLSTEYLHNPGIRHCLCKAAMVTSWRTSCAWGLWACSKDMSSVFSSSFRQVLEVWHEFSTCRWQQILCLHQDRNTSARVGILLRSSPAAGALLPSGGGTEFPPGFGLSVAWGTSPCPCRRRPFGILSPAQCGQEQRSAGGLNLRGEVLESICIYGFGI